MPWGYDDIVFVAALFAVVFLFSADHKFLLALAVITYRALMFAVLVFSVHLDAHRSLTKE